MIDFILAAFVVGGVIAFYLNNRKAIDKKAEEVENLFR